MANTIFGKQFFYLFTKGTLPLQYLNLFRKQYLQRKYLAYYIIVDYIIAPSKK